MRLTVIQLQPGSDKAKNIQAADHVLSRAITSHEASMVALPEMWTCLGGDRTQKLSAAESLPVEGSGGEGGPAYEFLRNVARRYRLYVHGGSMAELASNDANMKLYNTSVVFDPDGTEIARYRKIHLFDMTGPDGTAYRESATYSPGRRLVTVRIGDLNVGLAICYDLRFSEMFLALRQQGADLIMLPAAFTKVTGRDHWDVLLRARAIETQCWLAAPATCGHHEDASGGIRETYGHSTICDPWGRVVACASDGVGFVSADIERDEVERVRRNMPVLGHRVLLPAHE